MSWLKRLAAWSVVGGMMIVTACASDEEAEEFARRRKVLEDEKESLEKTLSEKASIEAALNRQIETQRQEIQTLQSHSTPVKPAPPTVKTDGSKTDAGKGEKTASISNQAGGGGSDWDLGGVSGGDFEVVRNKNGTVTLRIAGDVFAAGQDQLTKAGEARIKKAAALIRKNGNAHVSIEGHTDQTPLVKTKDKWVNNLGLSMARALAVHDFLVREEKISKSRLSVEGFGDTKPLIAGTTKAANEKNRRVELVMSRVD